MTATEGIYEFFVRDGSLARVAQIDDWTSAQFVLRFNRPGSWRIEGLPGDGAAAGLLTPGAGVVVRRNGSTLISGPINWPNRKFNDDENSLNVEGPDDLINLWDRLAHPSPSDGNFATQGYDVRSGACESVLKGYVSANAGPSAGVTARRVTGLTIEADAATGATVTGRARLQTLGEMLSDLAVSGGDLGFKIVQADTDPQTIQFKVYSPTDRTASVVFSPEFGNLSGFEYDDRAPTGNYMYVGGGGELTARSFVEGGDSDAIARWGRRIEVFVDQRQTTVVAELTQKRDEELATAAEQVTLQVAPIDTDAVTFGTHYNLGDRVTAVVDGVPVSQVIREVQIALTADGGEKVTPILATPQTSTPQVGLFSRLRSIEDRVLDVERD